MEQPAVSPHAAPRQDLVFGLGLLAAMIAQLALGGGFLMFDQPFRLDEVNTYTLVSDPDLGHAMAALSGGADYNPPVVYLLMRAFTVLTGTTEFGLRLFSFTCLFAGLMGVYSLLRLSHTPKVCATVALLLWARPIVMRQGFDARFYALWFAALAWYAFFMARSVRKPGLSSHIGIAVAAALTCSTHYFGILSWGLVLVGHAMFYRGTRGTWLASMAGPLALAACLGFYFEQKAALSVATWVKQLDLAGTLDLFRVWFPVQHLAVAAGVALAAWGMGSEPERRPRQEALGGGALGVIGMPVVLLVFSWLIQPVMVSRYGMVTILGFAPLLAALVGRTGPRTFLLILAYTLWAGLSTVQTVVEHASHKNDSRDQLMHVLREQPHDWPVVFESRQDFVPLIHYATDMADRFALLDFEIDETENPTTLRLCGRDVGRRYAELYPKFRMLALKDALRLPGFYLVAYYLPGSEYDSHDVRSVGMRVYEVRAR